jgi:hypothetical protein
MKYMKKNRFKSTYIHRVNLLPFSTNTSWQSNSNSKAGDMYFTQGKDGVDEWGGRPVGYVYLERESYWQCAV